MTQPTRTLGTARYLLREEVRGVPLLTPEDAAAVLKLTRTGFYQLVADGTLPAVVTTEAWATLEAQATAPESDAAAHRVHRRFRRIDVLAARRILRERAAAAKQAPLAGLEVLVGEPGDQVPVSLVKLLEIEDRLTRAEAALTDTRGYLERLIERGVLPVLPEENAPGVRRVNDTAKATRARRAAQ